jgi:hypothetical protein
MDWQIVIGVAVGGFLYNCGKSAFTSWRLRRRFGSGVAVAHIRQSGLEKLTDDERVVLGLRGVSQ